VWVVLACRYLTNLIIFFNIYEEKEKKKRTFFIYF
jgi:hypothetical protein